MLESLLHPQSRNKMLAAKACLPWGWAAGRVGCSGPSHGPAPLWVLRPPDSMPTEGPGDSGNAPWTFQRPGPGQ